MYLRSVRLLRETVSAEKSGQYPFSIPAIKELNEIEFDSPVTFFVGENGSGKSTLLEAIANKCEFNTASRSFPCL